MAITLALSARAGVADQSDPRLGPLFEQLAEVDSLGNALGLENAIWEIWIEIDDPEVSRLMSEGMTAMRTYRLSAALALFSEIVALRPDYAEGWNKRATIHYMLGNYEASLDDIAETLAREPRHFGALSGRGLVQYALGDEAAALQSFEAALAIHPFLVGARANAEALREKLPPI